MPGQPDGHHNQAYVENIGQWRENGIFGHVLIKGQQPAAESGEGILPAEVLIDDLICFPGNGKKQGGPK